MKRKIMFGIGAALCVGLSILVLTTFPTIRLKWQFPNGTKKDAVKVKMDQDYFFEYTGPASKEGISMQGYRTPTRGIESGESVLIYPYGEFRIYFFFDSQNSLIRIESCGS